MSVVRLDLAYDGSGFHGWAHQPRVRTVEGDLSAALQRVLGFKPKLSVAGRTDAGVHARGQVASFVVPGGVAPRRWAADRIQRAVNDLLAPEIVIMRAAIAPAGFDARFSATSREYRYRIDVGPFADPFTAAFVWHRPGSLDLGAMRRAAAVLVGGHDFAAFGRPSTDVGGTFRRLTSVTVQRRGDRVEVGAKANAFVQQMVRSLVGTLVAVGEGRMAPERVQWILDARDRAFGVRPAPPQGLTLEGVRYGRR